MLWEVEAKIILLSRRKQSEGKTVASPLWRPENYLGQMWQPEKQPFTDGYWALPPNLSNQQTIGQFCHFLWIILTSSSDHDAVMWHLFIWLISCMSQIFTQSVTHMLHTATTFHHITSLQCTDKKGIFCNRKLINWSQKGSGKFNNNWGVLRTRMDKMLISTPRVQELFICVPA